MASKFYKEDILARVDAVCGAETVARLTRELGGQMVNIPAWKRSGTRLAKAVGEEAAGRIAREIGRGAVLIPMGIGAVRARRIAETAALRKSGLSVSVIAAKLGVHTRTVERRLRQARRIGLL